MAGAWFVERVWAFGSILVWWDPGVDRGVVNGVLDAEARGDPT